MTHPLYRTSAIDHATNRLNGNVVLFAPLSSWALGGVFIFALAVALIFAATASYAKKETVAGWVTPEAGLVRPTANHGGVGSDLPTIDISTSDLNAGYPVMKAFVDTGLIASNGEGKRHIKAGAMKLNDMTVTSPQAMLSASDFADNKQAKLSIGKKKHGIARLG